MGLIAGLALVSPMLAHGAPATPDLARGARVEAITIGIIHRVFAGFRDIQKVKPNQVFILGDTDYSARVVGYIPDFTMDLTTKKIMTRSADPNNPAFKIIVWQGGVPRDTAWAFLNMPPHFAKTSSFGFQILRIDFVGRPPIVADTTVASKHGPAVADSAAHR
jgi:hypothetical protein